MNERELPQNLDAERAVLGSILIGPDCLPAVAAILTPGDFARESHGTIFRAMQSLDGHGLDFVAVCNALGPSLQQCGGPGYITQLITAVPTSIHAEHYARIVADCSLKRRLITAAGEIAGHAWNGAGADDALAFAHKTLADLSRPASGGLVSSRTIAGDLYDAVEIWSNAPLEFGQVRGLATGIPSLDQFVGGLYPGWLVLLAGRPAMGKSALAFEIARRIGAGGRHVLIFSLEMPARDVLARWASALSRVESRKVRRGVCPAKYTGGPYASAYVTPDELASYMSAVGDVSNMPRVWIDDQAGLTVAEIRVQALRQLQLEGPVDLVVVDHIGRIRSQAPRNENTARTEGRKTEDLAALAKEMQCPVLAVVQLNRAVESTADKIPSMTDLRDSGEHEQNAHVILGLYRDSYYKDAPGAEYDLQIIPIKNREGPSGRHTKITVRYEPSLSRFSEFEKGAK